MEERLQVGVISSTHGIRGEVKVFPTTDNVKRFKKGISLILDTGKEEKELVVEGVKFFKQFVKVAFHSQLSPSIGYIVCLIFRFNLKLM